MSRVLLLFVLLAGLCIGLIGAEMGLLDSSAPGDQACNAALGGESWHADLNESKDIENGTRLVCVHDNGTQTDVVVNVSVDVGRS